MRVGDEFTIGKVHGVWRGDVVDPEPGAYYVSCIDGGRFVLLLGPFVQHSEALAQVDAVRSAANKMDPRACFYAFGTARVAASDARLGVLNEHMGYTVQHGR